MARKIKMLRDYDNRRFESGQTYTVPNWLARALCSDDGSQVAESEPFAEYVDGKDPEPEPIPPMSEEALARTDNYRFLQAWAGRYSDIPGNGSKAQLREALADRAHGKSLVDLEDKFNVPIDAVDAARGGPEENGNDIDEFGPDK